MNSFIAILKDSLRESRNGYVLHLMIILCLISIIVIANIGFVQTTVKEEFDNAFGFTNRIIKNNPDFKTLNMSVEDYKETNPEKPWESNYEFVFSVKTETEEEMKKVKANIGLPGNRYRAERMMNQSLSFLNKVEVKTKETDSPTHLKYLVTTEGTKTPDKLSWRHIPTIFGYRLTLLTTSLRQGVFTLENYVIGFFGTLIILMISVIITAFFIPNMLQKGTVDLLISKPISRSQLLVYKFFGGLTFILFISVFLYGSIWLLYGLKYGLWTMNILYTIPLLTFYFAVLYSVSTLISVMTRSAIVAILATVFAWVLFFAVGKVNYGIEKRLYQEANPKKLEEFAPKNGEKPEMPDPDEILQRLDPESPLWGFIPKWTFPIFQGIHMVSPRTYQLDVIAEREIAKGVLSEPAFEEQFKMPGPSVIQVLIVNLLFIAVMLALSCWIFIKRDN